ncbi:MAG TPA: hypothetical protein VF190_13695 [Rhodothermales bacterium]
MEVTMAVDVDAAAIASARPGSEPERKRFRDQFAAYVPYVVLNPDGMIRDVTPSARKLLEYRTSQQIDPCFFAHVHGKNLYQVMRDVADMVCYGKNQASWLLRLRTGQGRWRWYKASVRNRLEEDEAIQIQLDDQSAW